MFPVILLTTHDVVHKCPQALIQVCQAYVVCCFQFELRCRLCTCDMQSLYVNGVESKYLQSRPMWRGQGTSLIWDRELRHGGDIDAERKGAIQESIIFFMVIALELGSSPYIAYNWVVCGTTVSSLSSKNCTIVTILLGD